MRTNACLQFTKDRPDRFYSHFRLSCSETLFSNEGLRPRIDCFRNQRTHTRSSPPIACTRFHSWKMHVCPKPLRESQIVRNAFVLFTAALAGRARFPRMVVSSTMSMLRHFHKAAISDQARQRLGLRWQRCKAQACIDDTAFARTMTPFVLNSPSSLPEPPSQAAASLLRHTPTPTESRNIAKGCQPVLHSFSKEGSLSEADPGLAAHDRKANPSLLHTPRPPASLPFVARSAKNGRLQSAPPRIRPRDEWP